MPVPVLFMIQHLDLGGSEVHFYDLLTRLDRTRFEPHVIYCNGGQISAKLEALGTIPMTRVPVSRIYDWSGVKAAWFVRRYARRQGIKVFFCFHFVADALGVLAKLGSGGRIKVISSRRDMGFTRTSRQIKIGRWMARHVDQYIAVSEAVRQAVARDEGVDPAKIEVIYNGSDLEELDREGAKWDRLAERRKSGIKDEEIVIGCIANFNAVKRHEVLLEAFAKLVRKRPDLPLRLLLAGDGPMRDSIYAKWKQLGLGDRVIHEGQSRQVAREYQILDIFVLPSETEGFSNAIVQAMAFQKPVVACRVGGNPEAVEDGVTGLLVPAGDADALLAALEKVAADSGLRRTMGYAGKHRATERFSSGAMLKRTASIISSL